MHLTISALELQRSNIITYISAVFVVVQIWAHILLFRFLGKKKIDFANRPVSVHPHHFFLWSRNITQHVESCHEKHQLFHVHMVQVFVDVSQTHVQAEQKKKILLKYTFKISELKSFF